MLFRKDKFDKILKYKGLGQPHTKTSYNELMKVTHSGQLFFTEVGSLNYHFEKSFWLNIWILLISEPCRYYIIITIQLYQDKFLGTVNQSIFW